MAAAVIVIVLLVYSAVSLPFFIEVMFEGDWWRMMREPRFPCARCEHVADGDRCAACFDRVTGEPLSCWTSRATKQCARSAKEVER